MPLGRSRATAAEAVVPEDHHEPTPYELAAIELLTVDGPMLGWIATDGARTSDWLNATDVAAIHGLRATDAPQPRMPPVDARPPTSVERDRIVWVVPPPLPANRHLRLHRRRFRVHLVLDGYEVVGQVHVRPGADANDAMLRGTRAMVPLTEVELRSHANPPEVAHHAVLIVNATHILRVVSDGPQRPGAAPEPEPAPAPAAPAVTGTPPVESPGHALVVLLEAGIFDVIEFQAMRARIGEAAASR